MSTLDAAGNSNRETPTYIISAITTIDQRLKTNNHICLNCNYTTRNLSDIQLEMLVHHYKINEGYKNTKLIVNGTRKTLIIE